MESLKKLQQKMAKLQLEAEEIKSLRDDRDVAVEVYHSMIPWFVACFN